LSNIESCIGESTFTDDDEEVETDTRKKLTKNMKKKATALEGMMGRIHKESK